MKAGETELVLGQYIGYCLSFVNETDTPPENVYLFTIISDGELVLRIRYDGNIEFGEGAVDMEATSMEFWNTMARQVMSVKVR